MKKWIFVISLLLSLCSSSVWASQKLAQEIIENWFSLMKNDPPKASEYLAPQFLSIHTDGKVRNKEQEMELIKNLKMKDYHLSNFKFSQSNNIIVVTFDNKGSEKIDNKEIGSYAAGRMAVLQQQGDKWLIVAYANLDKIG